MGNKKGLLKSILPWLIVLMVISVAIPFFNQSESSEIRYDKFIEIVQKEKVKDVEIALREKPKMIIGGGSAYSREWDYKRMREIADKIGAILVIEIGRAHV